MYFCWSSIKTWNTIIPFHFLWTASPIIALYVWLCKVWWTFISTKFEWVIIIFWFQWVQLQINSVVLCLENLIWWQLWRSKVTACFWTSCACDPLQKLIMSCININQQQDTLCFHFCSLLLFCHLIEWWQYWWKWLGSYCCHWHESPLWKLMSHLQQMIMSNLVEKLPSHYFLHLFDYPYYYDYPYYRT